MSDERPIGVFDSGVGGLTVLRALKAALPHERTVYLGDTARVPYGTRSATTVVTYAVNNARTLVAHGDIKCLVVACNTVSAVAIEALRAAVDIPVVGVIEPGAAAALKALSSLSSTRPGSIAVLGTPGTVRSGAYARALTAAGYDGDSAAVACPLFVPLAEEGWTSGDVPALVADRYLAQLPDDVAVVILGCTHYPLLKEVIRARLALLRPGAVVVDGAAATVEATIEVLHDRRRVASEPARHRLLVSDAPAQMAALAPAFLGEVVAASDVELVDVIMSTR
ncbi:MAG TPA: glutamate racemase [Myxococcota bacterium]